MRTLDEIQEQIAISSGYDRVFGLSAWFTLLNEIKGDAELIDFYIRCVANAYAEEALDVAADEFEYTPLRDDSHNIYEWIVEPESVQKLKEQLK